MTQNYCPRARTNHDVPVFTPHQAKLALCTVYCLLLLVTLCTSVLMIKWWIRVPHRVWEKSWDRKGKILCVAEGAGGACRDPCTQLVPSPLFKSAERIWGNCPHSATRRQREIRIHKLKAGIHHNQLTTSVCPVMWGMQRPLNHMGVCVCVLNR